jgi:hypothetical protein
MRQLVCCARRPEAKVSRGCKEPNQGGGSLTTHTRWSIQKFDKVVMTDPRRRAVRASILSTAHEVAKLTVACRVLSALLGNTEQY